MRRAGPIKATQVNVILTMANHYLSIREKKENTLREKTLIFKMIICRATPLAIKYKLCEDYKGRGQNIVLNSN